MSMCRFCSLGRFRAVCRLGLALGIHLALIGVLPLLQRGQAASWSDLNATLPVTWSVPNVVQTIYPGATTSVIVTFRCDKRIELVKLSVSSGLKGLVTVGPSDFEDIAPGKDYHVYVTFSAPAASQKSSSDGFLQLSVKNLQRSETVTVREALPMALRVDPSVKQDFGPLANALTSDHFDLQLNTLLLKFAPSQRERTQRILAKADHNSRVRLAEAFRNARFVYGTDDFQVYKLPWDEEDGTKNQIEINLARAGSEWVISSW